MKNKSASKNDSSNHLQTPKTEIKENEIESIKTEQETLEGIVKNENKSPSSGIAVKDNNSELKREIENNNVSIKVDPSEEASSDFETVSSVNSQDNIEVLDFSLSESDDDDFNVIVKIENELAYQNKKESSGNTCRWNNLNNNQVRYNRRINNCLHDYTNKKHCSSRVLRDQKYWERNIENKNNREISFFEKVRKRHSYNNKRCLSSKSDYDRLSRHSGSSEQSSRHSSERNSRHLGKQRFRNSRRLERQDRSRSPNYKNRKGRQSESFDQDSSISSLRSSSKKRIRSPCSRSVCDRLDRKKERTPFLVELERKLKEAEDLRNSRKANTTAPMEPLDASRNKPTAPPEMPQPVNQNPNPPYQPRFIPPLPTLPNFAVPLQCLSFPTLSLDNLPLVPGPTGLPVHITATGEKIPYDVDGRRIPVGPNGYYLPLDPTGRLFAHIVSPGNQAVPIHMTSDGVLRLPNSEPVPCGPGHKLPVDVDGTVIFIGPDSRPLYPCLNLPREPPLQILEMVNSMESSAGNQTRRPEIQLAEPQGVQNPNQGVSQSPQKDVISNIWPPVGKTNDFLNGRGVRKRRFDDDTGENPSVGSSATEDAKRAKTSQSNSVMASDSSSWDSTSRTKSISPKKEAVTEEIVLSSDEEDLPVTVCDKKDSEMPKMNAKLEDLIKRTQQVVEALNVRNYKPSDVGRFFVGIVKDFEMEKSPNESPLLRNRVKLPFVTPSFNEHAVQEEPSVNFRFSPQRNSEELEVGDLSDLSNPTSDMGVQCDFTSDNIKNLKRKITELEAEVGSLKRSKSKLNDRFCNLNKKFEEKTEELRKALSEIRVKKEELQKLKCLKEKWD